MSKRLTKRIRSRLAAGLQKIASSDNSVRSPELPDTGTPDRIGAHDLFSLFTASIIKKKTTFIR